MCSVCGIGCVRAEVRSQLGIVECLELTRAFAGSYVCDCGIAWRLMVLGVEPEWAGARAFRGGVEGGGSDHGCAGL